MENSQKSTSEWRSKAAPLLGAFTIFLMVATAVTAVEFFNRLKENRYIGRDLEFRNEITVTGRAEEFLQPDLALINLGVTNEAQTVEEAMIENTQKMNRIIEALKTELGLPEKDLKTAQFSLSPRYEWRTVKENGTGERFLAGYEVNQNLQVKIREFDNISQVIQQASLLGANQIGALVFTLEDEDSVKEVIRAEAIAQAQAKAKSLAQQLGVQLVRVTNFREDLPVIPWARAAGDVVYYDSDESVPAPSIQPGENKVEVSVSITYEIN